MSKGRIIRRDVAGSSLLPFEPTAKLPIRPEEQLAVRQKARSVTVTGETFSYTFSRANGLMTGLRVLEDDFSSMKGFGLPDGYVSSERDPRKQRFRMANEKAAQFRVVEARPERVILQARGRFRSSGGEAFPIRYTITHRIYIDGLDIVTIRCEAEKECELRWLVLSKMSLPARLCPYYANLPDQAFTQDTDGYRFARVPASKGEFLTGLFLPWVWLGNERTGVEITTWDVTPQQFQPTEYEFPDGGGMGDALSGREQPMFIVSRRGREVLWENFSLRNVRLPARRGRSIEGAFAIAVSPPKKYDPGLLDLRPVEGRYGMPEAAVEEVARRGANYLESLTGFNVDPVPARERRRLRQRIALLHKYNIRVVPYISANDMREKSEPYRRHGPEWRIEPGYSYRYRSSGMCNWAAGWRAQFKRTIDRIVDEYDFDGVYIDMWFGKMACENPAHGCNSRYRHISYLGLRDQLAYAYNRIKSKKPDAIIFNNTNVLPIAYITSLSDIRLVGEAMDVMDLDPLERMFLYFSQRLGSQTAWSTYGSELTTEQKLSFGLLICSLLPRHPYDLGNRRAWTEEQVAAFRRYRDIFRFFGVRNASLHAGLAGQTLAVCPHGDVYVNVLRQAQRARIMFTVVNMSQQRVRTTLRLRSLAQLGLTPRRKYLVYEAAEGKIVGVIAGSALRGLPIVLRPYGHSLLYVTELPKKGPAVIFATGADRLASEEWDAAAKTLEFRLAGPPGADAEVAVFSPDRPRQLVCAEKAVPFTYRASHQLLTATVRLDPLRPVRASW